MGKEGKATEGRGWAIASVSVFVVQILVALGAALLAGPGIYPDYDAEVVRHGVLLFAVVPLLDLLRQGTSAKAHSFRRHASYTSPLEMKRVGGALATTVATIVVALVAPWIVIPLFVVILIAAWLGANT